MERPRLGDLDSEGDEPSDELVWSRGARAIAAIDADLDCSERVLEDKEGGVPVKGNIW